MRDKNPLFYFTKQQPHGEDKRNLLFPASPPPFNSSFFFLIHAQKSTDIQSELRLHSISGKLVVAMALVFVFCCFALY